MAPLVEFSQLVGTFQFISRRGVEQVILDGICSICREAGNFKVALINL
jgi:hypothetical protein